MNHVTAIVKREFAGYFSTPLAYVFIVIFLLLSGVLTFYLGDLYGSNQADLSPFFGFLPFLFLFLIPAVGMRLWSEEHRSGTIELLMTLPISLWQAVLGKFLAAWAFAGVALALTFPLWITINYLGEPDNGATLAGYLGAFLMAGGFLAIGSSLSAVTKNQVIAFVLTVVVCFAFVLIGLPPIVRGLAGFLPPNMVEFIADFSVFTHWDGIAKGVLELRSLVYFASVIVTFLLATMFVLELKRAD
ncbi:MAG: ABC transporter permease subunit [Planctomycetota bacterium]